MNEIKLIHLGRQPFTVAVDAHVELRRYIDAIAKRTNKDVVEEIEIRMAELLIERGFNEKKVILSTDVDYLKENLGEPADFADDDDDQDESKTSSFDTDNKRLFRDSENGIISGVAAGIAVYTGIPVWAVRIIFVGLTFAWGTSILLYIALWLILPDAKTPSDRLQMSGKPVTLETLKTFVDNSNVRENAKEMGTKAEKMAASISKSASKSANGVIHATTAIGRTFLAFIGLILVVAGLASGLYVIGMGTYAIVTPESLFDAGALFPVGAREVFLLVLAMILAVIVLGILVSAGLALMRRKWPLPVWLSAAMLAILIAGGAIGVPIGFSIAPKVANRYNAARQTSSVPLSSFTGVDINGGDTVVTYVPSEGYSVDIETIGAIDTANIKPVIENNILKLNTAGFSGISSCSVFCIHTEDLHLIVHAPKLLSATVHTGATLKILTQLTQIEPLVVETSGDASLRLNYMNVSKVTLHAENGMKTMTLDGFLPAAERDTIRDADMWGVIIDKAGQVEFSGDQRCESDEPLVYVEDHSSILLANGKPLAPKLPMSQNIQDENTAEHCLQQR